MTKNYEIKMYMGWNKVNCELNWKQQQEEQKKTKENKRKENKEKSRRNYNIGNQRLFANIKLCQLRQMRI